MKIQDRVTPLVCALFLGAAASEAAMIKPGSSRAEVLAEFGAPVGLMRNGDREIFIYTNGKVELNDGTVVTNDVKRPRGRKANQPPDREARKDPKAPGKFQAFLKTLRGTHYKARKAVDNYRINKKNDKP